MAPGGFGRELATWHLKCQDWHPRHPMLERDEELERLVASWAPRPVVTFDLEGLVAPKAPWAGGLFMA